MNNEFQELRRQYSVKIQKEIAPIVDEMRKNLINRNCGKEQYTFHFTKQGDVLSIPLCDVEELFAIDGDMCPQGK